MTATHRLPAPRAEEWDWQRHAACRGQPSSVFFAPPGERGPARAEREAHAKRLCAACPVQTACQAYALTVGEPYGVWGGLSGTDRAARGARSIEPLGRARSDLRESARLSASTTATPPRRAVSGRS